MNYSEIKDLVSYITNSSIVEFEINAGGTYFRVNKASGQASVGSARPNAPVTFESVPVVSAPIEPAAPVAHQPAPAPAQKEAEGHLVLSPIVGTYYESQSTGKEPFVKVGQSVKTGDILCILEAMKVMNEITADKDGIIAEIFVQNGSMVESRQPLFRIE